MAAAAVLPAGLEVDLGLLGVMDDVCPLCIRPHPFTSCDQCLYAGYVVVHDPEKAKIGLKASRGRQRKPTASAIAASVPSIPSTASPSPSTASPLPPPQPPGDGEDASVLIAAAVHVIEDGYDSLSDNEEGLLEHPGVV